MSAARHIADILDEAKRLDADVDTLIQAHRAGKVIGFDDLAHIRRMTTVIRTHAARGELDLSRMPQLERRDEVLPHAQTIALDELVEGVAGSLWLPLE